MARPLLPTIVWRHGDDLTPDLTPIRSRRVRSVAVCSGIAALAAPSSWPYHPNPVVGTTLAFVGPIRAARDGEKRIARGNDVLGYPAREAARILESPED
jgi:hypothetical protein